MMDWMIMPRLLLVMMMMPTGALAGRLTLCSPRSDSSTSSTAADVTSARPADSSCTFQEKFKRDSRGDSEEIQGT
jgi:hypothetical protein